MTVESDGTDGPAEVNHCVRTDVARVLNAAPPAADGVAMELLSLTDAAARLGVTTDVVERMISDDRLVALRFASGIRVVLDDDRSAGAATTADRNERARS
jgi:hypothetical protein